jgi:hypothetical protein
MPKRSRKRKKNPAAVALGRGGGLKGGKVRMKRLSAKQRLALARRAALARWAKSLDVLVTVGEKEERIESLRLGAERLTVSLAFPLGDATVSLTFDAERFIAFAERVGRFARTLPGRPSAAPPHDLRAHPGDRR